MSDQNPASNAGNSPPESGSGPVTPKRSSLGRMLTLGLVVVFCVGAVCAVAYYQSELTGLFKVRPWDKATPRAAVERFVAAIQAGDSAAAEAIAPGVFVEVDEEGAVRVRPPSASPQMAPAPVEVYLPTGPVAEAPITYVYRMALTKVTYANADGQSVIVGLKGDGGMKVVSLVIE
jgi:hypothetical protein